MKYNFNHDVKVSTDTIFWGQPKVLFSLVLSELCERFSFYVILPILVLYMTRDIALGGLGYDEKTAGIIVAIYTGSIYMTPIIGGWLADKWLGLKMAIYYGAMIITLGHFSIALSHLFTIHFFYIGLVLITLGTGLFKPCISTIIGSIYSSEDPRRNNGFSIFYMGICFGSLLSILLTGWLIKQYGWAYAFSSAGIAMLISLLIFRNYSLKELKKYAQNHPEFTFNDLKMKSNPSMKKWTIITLGLLLLSIILILFDFISIDLSVLYTSLAISVAILMAITIINLFFFSQLDKQQKKELWFVLLIILFTVLFWSVNFQQPTTYALFAEYYTNKNLGGFQIPSTWFLALNPIVIILISPLFMYLWAKLSKNKKKPTITVTFAIALSLTAFGFLLMVIAAQSVINHHYKQVSMAWISFSVIFITLGELIISPIGLSYITKAVDKSINGQLMGLCFSSIALGGLFAGYIGSNVNQNNIEALPVLFLRCTVLLIISVITLLLIDHKLKKHHWKRY